MNANRVSVSAAFAGTGNLREDGAMPVLGRAKKKKPELTLNGVQIKRERFGSETESDTSSRHAHCKPDASCYKGSVNDPWPSGLENTASTSP